MKPKKICDIKITQYFDEKGKVRYLAQITMLNWIKSCNAGTLKQLLNQVKELV